jgi:hypothetical protein
MAASFRIFSNSSFQIMPLIDAKTYVVEKSL